MSNQNEAPCLCAHDITRHFGKTAALDGLSFSLKRGQTIGLLGRNGAGKSTLLRIVSGQLHQTSGTIEMFGASVYNNPAALGELCMIGDTPDFGKLASRKVLFRVCKDLFPLWDQAMADKLAKSFELPLNRPLKGFSRGMQTAMLLAVGLSSGAALTVFDEPSLGLDAVMRERFYDLLPEIRREHPERTFIISTHLIDEVARTLDYALLLDHGKLLCEGSIKELTARYMSISGAPEDVRAASEGKTVLREEEVAGSLVRYLHLNDASEAEEILQAGHVQGGPISLQRLFVFLTEGEKEQAGGVSHAENS
ncbi:MAG: ABC transporter ATP-binding protein [Clostridia bacterium]